MSEENKKYALIVETKMEEALVCESYISAGTYENVDQRMKRAAEDRNVTRVCMVELVYVNGNKELLK